MINGICGTDGFPSPASRAWGQVQHLVLGLRSYPPTARLRPRFTPGFNLSPATRAIGNHLVAKEHGGGAKEISNRFPGPFPDKSNRLWHRPRCGCRTKAWGVARHERSPEQVTPGLNHRPRSGCRTKAWGVARHERSPEQVASGLNHSPRSGCRTKAWGVARYERSPRKRIAITKISPRSG